VILVVCKIVSRDRPRRIDGVNEGALVGGRVIERDDLAVRGPQEAVRNAACVIIVSRDYSRRVDGLGVGLGGC
jgi:hypothetical protein